MTPGGRKPIDLVGQRFGRLAVLRLGSSRLKQASWLCLCDCGKQVTIASRHLRTGATRSCGCLAAETSSSATRTHGRSKTPTYRVWAAMWTRCTNPETPKYGRYGGRGISVCERWKSFENFVQDMGEKPPGLSIDRIDPDGNYELKNCRWATPTEQRHNRSRR